MTSPETTKAAITAVPFASTLYDELLAKYGPVMRSEDMAEVFKCHPSHIRAMCQSGELPARQVGKRWFVSTSKVAALIDGGDAYVGL